MTHASDASETVLLDPVGGREFRLLRCLGEGGFGAVYLASVRSAGGLQQQVAVKLLRPDVEAKNQAVDRLRDEAHVLASLRHPVILVAHDLVKLGDRVALVTEYVEGQDLREILLDRRAPIPVSALVDALGQVAGALDAAWTSLGIVHRDVKPANIRIGRHGNVKLMDFGIAISEVLARSAHTQGNIVMGSLSYLAPERFDVDEQPHPASDVFALGCVLFEGVTRHRLFHRLDAKKLFALTRTADVFAMYIDKQLSRPMPDGIRDLLRGVFRLDPDQRPTAAEMAAICDRLTVELPERISLRMWCRDRRWPGADATPSTPPRREAPRTPTPADPRDPDLDPLEQAPTEVPPTPKPPPDRLRPLPIALRSDVESPETGPTLLDPGAWRAALLAEELGDARDPLHEPTQEAGGGATLAVDLGPPPERPPSSEPASRPAAAAPTSWWRVAAVSVLGASGATVAIVVLGLVAVILAILLVAGLGRGDEVAVPPLSADELRPKRPPALPVEPTPPVGSGRAPATGADEPGEPDDPDDVEEAPRSPRSPGPASGRSRRRPASGGPDDGPEPDPAAAPDDAPAPSGQVVAADTWPLELRGPGGVHPAGEVPVGRYELWVDFGRGMLRAGEVEVAAGARLTVRCNAIRALCTAE